MTVASQKDRTLHGYGLIIDTAVEFCAVAVFDLSSGSVISKKVEEIGTGHAEILMGYVDEVVSNAGVSIREIKAVGVVTGPGSFTGIRVGVSTARGLALALGVPSIGVTTFDALSREVLPIASGRSVLIAIDARRGEFYTALYAKDGYPLVPAAVSTTEQAKTLYETYRPLLVGSGAPAIAADDTSSEIASLHATADIGTYAICVSEAFSSGQIEKPRPLYLRAPDAKPQAGFIIERR
ncbi:tRNA (adenosine(37)-N6)-threonylcarbamoyltransferase complex dimerization subunit type 1 TsaB [Limoniibacter endophyticus]|uniref:tRNA (Adenosine(37)-N6)-threonylcarbamoyltransferase complex dimerization subunit type 1 TsaB n=1 Tax=Limoniibacter endophyticus TaxID=1565040 RepID=A0A8J3DPR8_9HYPH|nr:tRNA (adenosine(37)-N6)-threonylcarbamoyltransferase complex dimerization subunit type 1 TsaB [Limoniibacter endophyticus]GHC74611.1 tRNA (adenosine(37)-N6)-threonylcarbamoyltransferase complex dimerization subunit type 1 TsaB [Limoniibacter endophyticus]